MLWGVHSASHAETMMRDRKSQFIFQVRIAHRVFQSTIPKDYNMPRDDYARATAKDKARKELAQLDYEDRQAVLHRLKHFPRHELIEQPDGSLRSLDYTFHVSRWN